MCVNAGDCGVERGLEVYADLVFGDKDAAQEILREISVRTAMSSGIHSARQSRLSEFQLGDQIAFQSSVTKRILSSTCL